MIKLLFSPILAGFFIAVFSYQVSAQTNRTNTAAGSLWFDGGTGWSAGVPDGADNVTFNNNAKATIQTGQNATILSLTTGNSPVITIDNGGSLTTLNFTAGNGTIINVNGNMTINGDLTVNNSIIWNITGTVTINGNVTLGNNAVLDINNTGTVNISGNFTGGNNTALDIDGSVTVGGNLQVANGSTITGAGTMSVSGTCVDGSSTFCGSGPLPVTLLFFKAEAGSSHVTLNWATATEINFDYFSVERSADGKDFYELAKMTGHGTTRERHDYEFNDNSPKIGKNYYRLRSIDFGGYTEQFGVVLVTVNDSKQVIVSPNPSHGDFLNLSVNFEVEEGSSVTVYDNVGGIIGTYPVASSDMTVNFLNTLQSGVYYLKFVSPSYSTTERLMVK